MLGRLTFLVAIAGLMYLLPESRELGWLEFGILGAALTAAEALDRRADEKRCEQLVAAVVAKLSAAKG